MVFIRKELNFRDLGGYPTIDGRHVRSGLFFRSGGLYRMSEREQNEIGSLNIRYIMDLRADWQRKRKPDPEIPGAQQIEHSGYVPEAARRIDFSPAGMHQTGEEAKQQFDKLELYYKEIIFGNLDFKLFLESVAEGKVPIIFHCASGKDRTGAAAILLLLALGVDEETLIADYEFSSFAGSSRTRKSERFQAYLSEYHKYGEDIQDAAYNYLIDIGITDEEILSIKSLLIEDCHNV